MKTPLKLGLMGSLGCWLLAAEVPVEPVKNTYGSDPWLLPVETTQLKEGEGLKVLSTNCLLCHSMDYVSTQPLLTRAQWSAGVDKMRARFGAVLSTNAIPPIVEYLTRNYGQESPKP